MRFEGGQQIAKNLAQLEKGLSRRIQLEALRAGAEPIRARAASLAPRDETAGPPHLADNIVISDVSVARSERGDRVGETAVEVGPALKPTDAFYGYFQEYGTAHHAAQPFMRPAFDTQAPGAIGVIRQRFWDALRRLMPRTIGTSVGGRFA